MGKLFFSFMPPPPLYFTASTTTTENTIISTFPRDRDFFLHKLMFLSGSGQVGREREGERESLFDAWAGCMCGSACFERGENIKIWRIPFFSELVHVA